MWTLGPHVQFCDSSRSVNCRSVLASPTRRPFAGLGEYVVGHLGSVGIEVASLQARKKTLVGLNNSISLPNDPFLELTAHRPGYEDPADFWFTLPNAPRALVP